VDVGDVDSRSGGECLCTARPAAAGRGAGAKVDGESDAPTNLTSDDESRIVALIKKAAR